MSFNEHSPLDVFEYNGTARSGKGTIVAHLKDTYPNVAVDETGADYRAVTRALISEHSIEPGMKLEQVQRALASVSFSALAEMAASRADIVATHGLSSLYEPDVAYLVSMVGQREEVRGAVKAGFKKRVEKVRDSGEYDVLAVDGRNLSSVISKIEGTRLLVRTFVSCKPIESAWRECARKGIDFSSSEGREIIKLIQERNDNDAGRPIDPVRPDPDAIDYWYNDELFHTTIQHYANTLYGGDYTTALQEIFIKPQSSYNTLIRIGAGTLAVTSGRQVHLDTTYFRAHDEPKDTMLKVASTMFEEALEARPALNK